MELTKKCADCGNEFTASRRSVKKCYPCRIVHQSNPIEAEPYITVTVNEEVWLIEPVIVYFRKPQPTNYFPRPNWEASTLYVNMNMENLAKKLSHMQPNISTETLTNLFKTAIKQGVFSPLDQDRNIIRVFLTVDSWLKLQHTNSHSKWQATTIAIVNSVIRNQTKNRNLLRLET